MNNPGVKTWDGGLEIRDLPGREIASSPSSTGPTSGATAGTGAASVTIDLADSRPGPAPDPRAEARGRPPRRRDAWARWPRLPRSTRRVRAGFSTRPPGFVLVKFPHAEGPRITF